MDVVPHGCILCLWVCARELVCAPSRQKRELSHVRHRMAAASRVCRSRLLSAMTSTWYCCKLVLRFYHKRELSAGSLALAISVDFLGMVRQNPHAFCIFWVL